MSDLLHRCMNCADTFDPEFSQMDQVCDECSCAFSDCKNYAESFNTNPNSSIDNCLQCESSK